MWLVMKWKEYRQVKKVKSIYPDVKYQLHDRVTGKFIRTVFYEDMGIGA